MLKYVEEEVERVKGLFQQKEARLAADCAAARAEGIAAAAEAAAAADRSRELEERLSAATAASEVPTGPAYDGLKSRPLARHLDLYTHFRVRLQHPTWRSTDTV